MLYSLVMKLNRKRELTRGGASEELYTLTNAPLECLSVKRERRGNAFPPLLSLVKTLSGQHRLSSFQRSAVSVSTQLFKTVE